MSETPRRSLDAYPDCLYAAHLAEIFQITVKRVYALDAEGAFLFAENRPRIGRKSWSRGRLQAYFAGEIKGFDRSARRRRTLRTVALALLVIGSSLGAAPVPRLSGNALKGQVFLTHPRSACAADAKRPVDSVWTTPRPVRIRRVRVWMGFDAGNVVDSYTTVFAGAPDLPQGYVLHNLAFDHYAPFTGIHQDGDEWDEAEAVVLPAGGRITAQHMCNGFGQTAYSHAQVRVDYEIVL